MVMFTINLKGASGMEQEPAFSFETRLAIARIARLVRKSDGLVTGLSNQDNILELLKVASHHSQTAIRTVLGEMFAVMNDEEMLLLHGKGIALPAEHARRLAPAPAKPATRPQLVYRGQVVEQ